MATAQRDFADLLMADELSISRGWSARFSSGDEMPVVAAELLHRVLEAMSRDSIGAADPALAESSYGLGVLRAQQGLDTVGLVEEVLSLRPFLWAHLANLPATRGDIAMLLLMQERLAEILDAVLRATLDAYVGETQQVLQRQATRDPLTGLLNRAAFTEAIDHEVAAAVREQPPALLVIDLDGFKLVNDSLGHHAGDDVLVRVAQLLGQAVRSSDVVARLGGDEFAVLLPRADASTGLALGHRLLREVEMDGLLRSPLAPVGFSIGVACLSTPRSSDELVDAADTAMYQVKHAGGSGVGAISADSLPVPTAPPSNSSHRRHLHGGA